MKKPVHALCEKAASAKSYHQMLEALKEIAGERPGENLRDVIIESREKMSAMFGFS